MARNRWMIGTLAMMATLGAAFPASATESDSAEPIPVVLVDEQDTAETPAPTCTVCARLTKKISGDTSTTSVLLTHAGDFAGDVELVVWLDTEERVSVWISDVNITDGDELTVEVQAEEGWDWSDVRYAWVRYYDAL